MHLVGSSILWWGEYFRRTVNSDSNALVESVAISTDKGRNLSKLIKFEVLGRDTLGRLSLNNLEVNIVGLRDCADGSGAGVALREKISQMLPRREVELKHVRHTGYV